MAWHGVHVPLFLLTRNMTSFSFIFYLLSLETLHLSKTNFSGTLPVETRQLSNMRKFNYCWFVTTRSKCYQRYNTAYNSSFANHLFITHFSSYRAFLRLLKISNQIECMQNHWIYQETASTDRWPVGSKPCRT